ncbi:unnamed protein product [Fraxinus pennsylvanica]|uniref:Uncharacterized protein n=1 Tax=Fraxinus pennsylvanica TaxID=56036 RepID=A0AAD2A3H7_9LAMI|nr:unnamed protein product [Fraxinus pennsylvanica]
MEHNFSPWQSSPDRTWFTSGSPDKLPSAPSHTQAAQGRVRKTARMASYSSHVQCLYGEGLDCIADEELLEEFTPRTIGRKRKLRRTLSTQSTETSTVARSMTRTADYSATLVTQGNMRCLQPSCRSVASIWEQIATGSTKVTSSPLTRRPQIPAAQSRVVLLPP